MRVLVVENFHSSPLGQVGIALRERGADIYFARPWQGEALPTHEDFKALVVLGGEQSALDDEKHPYLPHLASLMKSFGDADKPVLGICLGSQLLARAHGGRNLLGEAREFGWRQVNMTKEAASDPVLGGLSASFPIFQWHSDTFTLPESAVHLAHNETAINQCFRVGRASYGMQFHFEANRDVVSVWNGIFPEQVQKLDPQWLNQFAHRAATEGAKADETGLAIARRWASLIEA